MISIGSSVVSGGRGQICLIVDWQYSIPTEGLLIYPELLLLAQMSWHSIQRTYLGISSVCTETKTSGTLGLRNFRFLCCKGPIWFCKIGQDVTARPDKA